MQLQPTEPLPKIMMARYYGNALGRFLSVDPAFKPSKNLNNPQRWNRYLYTLNNPVASIDPDGQEELKVTVTTSIPQARVTAPSLTGMRTFAGDAGGGTFRTSNTIVVETDPSKRANPVVANPRGETGVTKELDSAGRVIKTGQASGATLVDGAARGSDGSTAITSSGNEANPLVAGSPGITYDLTVTVDQAGNFEVSGSHDGFPGYQVDVTRENGTTTTIYSHDPRKTGKGVGSLLPPAEHDVQKKGKL